MKINNPNLSARELAYQLLLRIERDKSFAGLVVDKALDKTELSARDKRLVTELVYGTIRHQGTLDWVIAQFAKKQKKIISFKLNIILRLGIYQLLYLTKIPAFAATHEMVKIAKQTGLTRYSGFVNALLRRVAENRDRIQYPDKTKDIVKHLAVKYSHPEWMVRIFLDRFGAEETEQLCELNNQPASVILRVNRLKTSVEHLEQILLKKGIRVSRSDYAPEGLIIAQSNSSIRELPGYNEGSFAVQDTASMLVSHLVNPQPGQTVVDLCAAPGGKATHLAELMQNQGKLTAVDLHPGKAKLIDQTAHRLGISIIQVLVADGTKLADKILEPVDAVLLDAPCSGLGVLRRKVDSRWRKEPESIPELVALQNKLLESAYSILKPGGVLVYSTCTLTRDENEPQIERFLALHPELRLENAKDFLPEPAKPMVTKEGYYFAVPHRYHTDGIFGVRMVKKQ
ncbi:MAG: 16S rRNA (cytosine(967)-C(5))-methyltransferase RsmB [bacterium]|nr:16S rRNA (cytosine(967)-C(5))-methyltransferase RsmB [bacterium]